MLVSPQPAYYAYAVMCEEQMPFFFILILNLLCLGASFFAVIVSVTWCDSCFESPFVCSPFSVSRKRDANLFTFLSGNKYSHDGSCRVGCHITFLLPV
jgi:hypothetical protein